MNAADLPATPEEGMRAVNIEAVVQRLIDINAEFGEGIGSDVVHLAIGVAIMRREQRDLTSAVEAVQGEEQQTQRILSELLAEVKGLRTDIRVFNARLDALEKP